MFTEVYFAQGHIGPDKPVVDWEVDFSTAYRENVVLTASIQDEPTPPIFPSPRGKTATTVAFRMDPRVAMALHAKLTALAHSMGWLPKTEGGPPA
jgi:hypothetical protein